MRKSPIRDFLLHTMLVVAAGVVAVSAARAVDFEQFEFNDSNFTELDGVANTGTPGGNMWFADIDFMVPAETFNGSFRISKDNDAFSSNYLQIDNVASGTRYLVARMSGWAFRGFDASEPEEIRFAFLNEDTGNSGNQVTAQMQIARDTTSQAIELRGDAIGPGSSNVGTQLVLATDQAAPFTMVLELNKTSNSYKVFYKDGSNPSQFLGAGTVDPSRGGNSVRFVVNNNFGSDLSTTAEEFFAIDRFAVSDANPLTDLMTLQIDRGTGAMTLINSTGAALSGLTSYSVSSASGALNTAGWKPIANNYDKSPPGNGSVDVDDKWAVNSSTTAALSEAVVGGNGGNLANNQQVVLSQGAGAWIKNPFEDLEITLNFTGGVTRRANVNFVGNGGKRYEIGDLNFDGALTAADWTLFNAGGDVSLAGKSQAQAYQFGDLNNDGANDLADFGIFKNAYEAANGPGSFAALIAVPEPAGAALLALGCCLGVVRRRRRKSAVNSPTAPMNLGPCREETSPMKRSTARIAPASRLLPLACTVAALVSAPASAAILEDFQFNEVGGTDLGGTANTGVNANPWQTVDATNMVTSTTDGAGSFRIQKANTALATNYFDIANVTTGKAWAVMEMSGWNFSTLVGPTEFDSTELEEIRLAFLNNDGGTGGSTITGQAMIQRNNAGGVELVGRLTTGAPEIAPLALTTTRNTPFAFALEINENTEQYSVYYKDGANPYVLLGTAPHQSGRDGNSIRFAVNNSFSGTGEFFAIDRMYVTDVDPTNVSNDRLMLEVNTTLNTLTLKNSTATSFTIDGYTIESPSSALNFAGWNSLSDRGVDAIDGPDGGTTLGDGVGETWDETGGSSDAVLSERFLLGDSTFGTNRSETLGNAFKSGGAHDLVFTYRDAASGSIFTGDVAYVTSAIGADFNNDGKVNGTDFLSWQRGFGINADATKAQGDADGNGAVNAADLTIWRQQYGTGGATPAVAAVPEPTGAVLMTLSLAALGCGWRRKS